MASTILSRMHLRTTSRLAVRGWQAVADCYLVNPDPGG
jgi:hypothetical protein